MAIFWCIGLSGLYGQTFIKNFSAATSFVKLGTMMYFAGGDVKQGYGLWKTDGTAEGTVLVKNIAPGQVSYPIANLLVYNNKIYFAGNDSVNGQELWVSDGTADGTSMLKDINQYHTGDNGSQPSQFTICNGMLFFTASTGSGFITLWKTDGTASGTVQLTTQSMSGLAQLTAAGNTLYFTTGNNRSLWRSDGTAAGTKMVKVDDYDVVDHLHAVNDQLIMISAYNYDHPKIRLYKIEPANDAATLLQTYNAVTYGDIDIDNITGAAGSTFFYSIRTVDANDKALDALWTSDGTPGGTHLVKSYAWSSHQSNSYMQNFTFYNNKFYFALTSSFLMYTSDGTDAGTTKISTTPMTPSRLPVFSNQKLFFTGNGGLSSFDGNSVKQETTQPTSPDQLFDVNGTLYFTSANQYSIDLWSNAPMGQMQVTGNYGYLASGGNISFNSKVDSILTTAINIKNIGNKDLILSEVSVSGNSFYVNGKPTQTIQPGKTTTLNLLYDPTKEEQSTGAFVIKNNDSANGLFKVSLNGTAAGTAKNRNNIPAAGLLKAIVFSADSLPKFAISNNSILENAPSNTLIGSFSMGSQATGYQYTLTSGIGDGDNASFNITNGQLKSLRSFDFETKNTFTLRVKATKDTSVFQKNFVIAVTDVQEDLVSPVCGITGQDLAYTLDDVAYTNNRIIAVGAQGKILTSVNDGVDWNLINTGTSESFGNIQMLNDNTGYVLGYYGSMVKTEDGGASWFPIESPDLSYPYLNRFYFYSALVGYWFGDYKLYKTIDGGKSWKKLSFSGSSLSAGWFVDEDNGFICGNGQLLMRTSDGGATWVNVTTPSQGFNIGFSSIAFSNANNGFIGCSNGVILQTKDGGATWTKAGTAPGSYINRMKVYDEKTFYILLGFNGGGVYKTIDGGATWTTELNTANSLLGIGFNAAKNKYCLVGHALGLGSTASQGRCIYLKNGSDPWAVKSSIGGDNYYTENVLDANTVYIFGSGNAKTTDGGITWKKLNVASDTYNAIRASWFTSKDVGYYGNLNYVYKTINGGDTWTQLNVPGYNNNALTIKFINDNVGFVSTYAGIFKTVDAGATWTKPLTLSSLGGVNDICFVDQQTAYAVGFGSNLYKTTDQGSTWTSSTIAGDLFLMSCYFFDSQTGIAGGQKGTLIRTTDGGKTWTNIYTPAILTFYGFTFYDKMHGYATTNNNNSGSSEIYETFDAGLSWSRFLQTGAGIFQTKIAEGAAIAVGDGGTITKYSSVGLPPVNAGYIKGDTVVVSGNTYVYSLPAVSNSYYRWAIQGPASVTYQNNSVNVAWKQGGTYTIQATPYNSCNNGTPRTITVVVQDIPDPVISGPDTVFSKTSNINYTATNHNSSNYTWAVTGGTAVSNNNQTSVNWGNPGAGLVTVVETNTTLNVKKSASKSISILPVPFTLPANNFTVSTTGSSCKGTNNGSISVKAVQKLNYIATLTSPDNSVKTIGFADSLSVTNLVPGNYNICFTITGNNTYQKCFNAVIAEPKDLSVYSTVSVNKQIATLNMSGAEVYYVRVNDSEYQTNGTQIDIPLKRGINHVKVYTDKQCQGVFEKSINLDLVSLYPNPVVDKLTIDLGGNNVPQANVEIRNIFGKLMFSKTFVNNGVLNVDVSSLQSGLYVVNLLLGTTQTDYKIIKK
ncbi:Glycosyl hydrolase family 32 domain protein [Mucilaginibacter paludis DSM 18603]|uniref:Glycosyl hydrolase family 32 domain protein n=2 Tax=Mucilaginibacter TaxID=423349 RepID=H1Y8K8_9SPHI|nr:Glycosyl hydrolase family 32 domain protein [Mucilaginibacter paludis DSM 18603]